MNNTLSDLDYSLFRWHEHHALYSPAFLPMIFKCKTTFQYGGYVKFIPQEKAFQETQSGRKRAWCCNCYWNVGFIL